MSQDGLEWPYVKHVCGLTTTASVAVHRLCFAVGRGKRQRY